MSKRYREGSRAERLALSNLTLSVEAHTHTLLLGPSGAGKSTLLALGAGVLLPTHGEVLLFDEPFSRWRDAFRAKARREQLAYVPQSLALLPELTVLENLLLGDLPNGAPSLAHQQQALRALARFDLEALANFQAKTLSSGERQRTALARALRATPAVLLLDEPSANLDTRALEQLVSWLEEHRTRGAAVLVATHDPRLRDALSGVHTKHLALEAGSLLVSP